MTVQTSARVSTQIQVKATAMIYKQVVIDSSFPTNPIQQVLYIVGSVQKYWNGSAWVTLGGGGSTVHNDLTGRDAANAHPASSISGLATVATSGSYNDLSGTPTIPTKLTATITIAVADWSGGTTCTKTVIGVTADTYQDYYFSLDASRTAAASANVRPTGQGVNTITFTAASTPTAEISMNIVIKEV